MIMWRIKFKGEEYLLVNNDNNQHEGAIATKEEWEGYSLNKFHLFDNEIMSYGEVVGSREDIEWIANDYD